MIYIEPAESKLGIKIKTLEVYSNEKGVLQVAFRYNSADLNKMENGIQVQYENILENQYRGNHYHFPNYAGEEFFLIEGLALLIVCDLNSENFEIYLLKEGVSYFIPALVPHKVLNIGNKFLSKERVEILVSKYYNHSIKSLQTPFEIYHCDLDAAIDKLVAKVKYEKL